MSTPGELDVWKFCDEWLAVWSGNQPEKLVSFYQPDAVYVDPANPAGLIGHAHLTPYFQKLLAANPGWKWQREEIHPTYKGFVLKWKATIPTASKTIVEHGMDLVELRDGKISRNEVYFDRTRWLDAVARKTAEPFTLDAGTGVQVRVWRLEDAPALFSLVDANREHLRPWLLFVDVTKSVADIETFILSQLDLLASQKGLAAGVWFEGHLAGAVGVHAVEYQARRAAIGYWIAKPYEGRGIMTRATKAIVDYCFQTLQLNKVEIHCATENKKSRAIPERLGFKNEGTLRDVQWLYDHFANHEIYGMRRSEWQNFQRS